MANELVLALDLGGTKVEAALVDPDGVVLDASRSRAPTGGDSSPADLDAAVLAVVDHALSHAPSNATIIGAGIAAAGPIDERAGTLSPINIPQWRDYPLRTLVSERVRDTLGDTPVHFHRDGVAIVLAAHWLGNAAGTSNLLGMVISTGIGGGFISGGRVLAGNSGHIGQIQISGFTGELSIGSRTTLESVASGPHTVAWANTQGWSGHTGEDLARSYRNGDPIARRAVVRVSEAVGQAICSACALVETDVVAIGGGFSRVATDLVPMIAQVVSSHPLEYVSRVHVVDAGLPETAPLTGAAALVYRRDLVGLQP
ncbi:MAG: sugar kinase [Gordonia sp.]|uniref:ROK family protein n=1 Tax=Gordonia rubripertincta TaxID=36822 RepID=A0ABT4N361_GORRU|nr:ROK family protein [Gordonia rubripertincta]MBA4021516.1 sugar kinase [Gordonia sp. (in: high G+C Gram-positive bacteria)]MCZ4552382.1 ROK family protein [Gordonia rubripertincta]